jgi:hypothetical protein
MSTDQLIRHLREAKEYAKSCQINHVELREAYLLGLADAIVTKKYPHLDLPANRHLKPEQVAKEIKELIKREQRRRMYRKIGHCLQPESFILAAFHVLIFQQVLINRTHKGQILRTGPDLGPL